MGTQAPAPGRRGNGRLAVFLEACADACVDGERGYTAVAERALDPALRAFCDARSAERARFANELNDAIAQLGVGFRPHGTARGAAHRGLLVTRAAISARGDRAMVEECERGEKATSRLFKVARHEAGRIGAAAELRDLLEAQDEAIDGARLFLVRHFFGPFMEPGERSPDGHAPR